MEIAALVDPGGGHGWLSAGKGVGAARKMHAELHQGAVGFLSFLSSLRKLISEQSSALRG